MQKLYKNTVSYWNMTAEKAEFPHLEQNIETDILIIGGGITGVTCAYCLAERGLKPVLIEAGSLCDGTTGNTTGKITIQHGIIYNNIIRKYDLEFASRYAESQSEALSFVRRLVAAGNIDCSLAESEAFIYASSESDLEALENEYTASVRLGIDSEFIEKPGFPAGSLGMLGFKSQAVFHPVRYVNALARLAEGKGARLYCSTKAMKIEDGDIKTVLCDNGVTIKAKHLVMATQYPIYDGPNLFFTRLYAKRTYGIAVKAPGKWPDGSFINVSSPTRSIRTHIEKGEPILIVVGEGHPTGRGEEDTLLHFERLEQFAEEIAGKGEVLAGWSAQDYETPDQVPYIGRVSDNSDIYVATGFGKWGLTNGTLAGNLIAELIDTGICRYGEVYSRERGDLSSSLGKTFSEVFSSVGELIKSKFERFEDIEDMAPGEGRVINFEGKRAGIYRDFDGNVTSPATTCRQA